jgi:hypothetical protein
MLWKMCGHMNEEAWRDWKSLLIRSSTKYYWDNKDKEGEMVRHVTCIREKNFLQIFDCKT